MVIRHPRRYPPGGRSTFEVPSKRTRSASTTFWTKTLVMIYKPYSPALPLGWKWLGPAFASLHAVVRKLNERSAGTTDQKQARSQEPKILWKKCGCQFYAFFSGVSARAPQVFLVRFRIMSVDKARKCGYRQPQTRSRSALLLLLEYPFLGNS